MATIEKREPSSHAYNQNIAHALAAEIIASFHPCFLALKTTLDEQLQRVGKLLYRRG